MAGLAVGLAILCGHFVRGFLAAARLEAVSCAGCNQTLLMFPCVQIAPDYRYWQGRFATIQEDIDSRGREPLMIPSVGWCRLRSGLVNHLDRVVGIDIGLSWKLFT